MSHHHRHHHRCWRCRPLTWREIKRVLLVTGIFWLTVFMCVVIGETIAAIAG